ncbi:MAG: hypothetical protein WC011_03305 [Candidatus Paceibacterota bacterium]
MSISYCDDCGSPQYPTQGGDYCPVCDPEKFTGVSLETRVVKPKFTPSLPILAEEGEEEDEV